MTHIKKVFLIKFNMEQRRIEWIDQCKAFAIFFMIFFHCGGKMDYTWGALNHLLGPWNMPVFLFCRELY